jgi:hypothetical protein
VTYVNCPQVDSTRRSAAAAAAATAAANHAATSRKQTAQESRRKLNQPQENQGENHTKRTAPASHIGISTVDKYKQIVIVAIHTYIYIYIHETYARWYVQNYVRRNLSVRGSHKVK